MVLLWQTATVHFNYGGNWTALFCTGDLSRAGGALPGTYVFQNSPGYDGQFYRLVAHDPWLRKGYSQYIDVPLMRRARIFAPASAWLLAFGRDRYIDGAYIALILLSIFFGAYWLGRWAEFHGAHTVWGLAFLLVPGTIVSIDRMILDGPLTALFSGVLWFSARNRTTVVFPLLAAAALTRETGFILIAACCACALFRREWRHLLLYAAAALPAIAWLAFMYASPPSYVAKGSVSWLFDYPAIGILMKLFMPESYPFGPSLTLFVQALDVVALLALFAALVLAAWSLRRWPFGLEQWVAAGFLLLFLAVSTPGFWTSAYNYARVFSPLLLVVLLPAVKRGAVLWLVPVLLLDLRIVAQLAPQAWGVLRGLM